MAYLALLLTLVTSTVILAQEEVSPPHPCADSSGKIKLQIETPGDCFSLDQNPEINFDDHPHPVSWQGFTATKKNIRFPISKLKMNFAKLNGSLIVQLSAYRVDLAYSELRALQAKNVVFDESSFLRANLRGAKLYRASLRRANLFETNMHEADLSFADLRGADLRGADLTDATAFGAKWDGALFDDRTHLPFSEQTAIVKGMVKKP